MSTTPQQPTYIIPAPAGPNWKTPLLIGSLLLLLGSNIYLFVQLDHMRTDNRAQIANLNSQFTSALEKMKLDSYEAVQQSTRRVQSLQSELARSRRAAEQAVGQAKIDAQRRVESLQTKVTEEQAAQQQAIAAVKQTADTATTQLASVNTDVQNTKSQLEQAVANLKHATGELDSHSSLIATNSKELQALRELGERNYAEFTINKSSKTPTRVADVLVQLKKVDVKRNRFTIAITADDKTVEKKDRTLNEPIQFYTLKARQPDEIVVNQVRKDAIVGYLATPKVQTGRVGS
jgi:chromosome segregation ATPase